MTDDRAEPGGSLLELNNRPPEEWELYRPVQVHVIRVRGPIGVVTVRPHPLADDAHSYSFGPEAYVSPRAFAALVKDTAARPLDDSFRR